MATSKTAERVRRPKSFGAPHVFVLAVIDGDDPTRVHRILRTETTIGRTDPADFVIEDDQISQQHIRIRVEGSVCTLQDLESLNGTRVNGSKVRSGTCCRLRHLDEIQIGGTRLFLLSGKSIERKDRD